MSDEPLNGYPDSLLKREMQQAGMSIQGLAKLVGGADHATRETARTAIRRWLRDPDMGITRGSSSRLAPHFQRPPEFFVRPSKPRQRQANRLEALAARVEELASEQETILQDLADARTRIAQLEAVRKRRPAAPKRPRQRPA